MKSIRREGSHPYFLTPPPQVDSDVEPRLGPELQTWVVYGSTAQVLLIPGRLSDRQSPQPLLRATDSEYNLDCFPNCTVPSNILKFLVKM